MIDEIEPRCPNCDYDLRGLPIPHRCPECGKFVDVVQTVWKPSLYSLCMTPTFVAPAAALGLIGFAATYALAGAPHFAAKISIVYLFLIGAAGMLLRYLMSAYQLTFGPSGLSVRRLFSVETVYWDRVSHLQQSHSEQTSWEIRLTDPSESLLLPPILADEMSVRDFHRSLAFAKARWGPRAAAAAQCRKDEAPTKGGDKVGGLLRDLPRIGPCPWCKFELTGYPAQSVCLSCGNEYSPALRVWKAPRKLEIIGAVITLAPIAVWGLYILMLFCRGRPLGIGHKMGGGVVFAIGFFIAFLLEQWEARDGVVMANERGIEVRRSWKTARIEWAHILGIRREEKNIVLTTAAGPRRIDRFFATAGDAEEFVRYADGVKKGTGTPKSRESLTK